MLLYAVRGPGSHMNIRSRKLTVVKDLHDAVSFSRLSSFCKMIVPVGLPFLSRSKSNYHFDDFGCLLCHYCICFIRFYMVSSFWNLDPLNIDN